MNSSPGNAEYIYLQIKPISRALGAVVEGVDVGALLDEAVIEEIHRALLENLVIFFRDQKLEPGQLLAFAERFGSPQEYPQVPGLPDCPWITSVTKLEHERINFGGVWHSDTTYVECPPKASMLYAIEIPPCGGDTLFANQYLAYETLSDGLRSSLSDLLGVSDSAKAEGAKTREDRQRDTGAAQQPFVAKHPVVRTRPGSGRKALYINRGHTTHINGWTEAESEPMLNFLYEHQVRSEFTCRFSWKPGSLAFWDNRCTQHYPLNDYHGFKRVMHRLTLAGERPF